MTGRPLYMLNLTNKMILETASDKEKARSLVIGIVSNLPL